MKIKYFSPSKLANCIFFKSKKHIIVKDTPLCETYTLSSMCKSIIALVVGSVCVDVYDHMKCQEAGLSNAVLPHKVRNQYNFHSYNNFYTRTLF